MLFLICLNMQLFSYLAGFMHVHHTCGYKRQCLGFRALHWSGTQQKKAREKSRRPNGVALHCLTPQLSGELAQLQHFLNEQSSKKQVILYLLQLLQCSLKQIQYSNREEGLLPLKIPSVPHVDKKEKSSGKFVWMPGSSAIVPTGLAY